jgi:hypothetical protein
MRTAPGFVFALIGTVLCSCESPALAQITLDGVLDSIYGSPCAVQNTQTQFGDASVGLVDQADGSELDTAYAAIVDGALHLFFGGNLQSNFSKLDVFIDAVPGGQQRLRGNNPDVDFNGLNRMGDDGSGNGMAFDDGFAADAWLSFTCGGTPFAWYLNHANLLTDGGGSGGYLGTGAAGAAGARVFKNGIGAAIDNSNTRGVTAGSGTASGDGVRTGIELRIPLTAIAGYAGGAIRVCAFINGGGHDFVSNQVLGGLSGGGNLGEPRLVDFRLTPGLQWFVAADPCTTVSRSSGALGSVGAATPRSFDFTGLQPSASSGVITVEVRSDLDLVTEFLTLRLDGQPFATLFAAGGADCPTTPDRASLEIPAATLASLLADGVLSTRIEASPGVNGAQCSNGHCEITLQYRRATSDCDANGVDDQCQIASGSADCNGNGTPDTCDIASGSSGDVDSNGVPDSCQGDCNGNGVPDAFELAAGAADCNGNIVLDSCDIAAGTSSDIDVNGVPDTCQADCNGNALPDSYEIVLAPQKDCDSDSVLDTCEIASNAALDCNGNLVLDSCEPPPPSDCDGDGVSDLCEIANGAQDKDADGTPDSCEYALGDFDLDGAVGGADLSVLLSLWGFTATPIGDLDGDGLVAGADLSILLGNWGPTGL